MWVVINLFSVFCDIWGFCAVYLVPETKGGFYIWFFLGDFFVSFDNPSFFLLSLFVYSRQLHPCRSMPLFLHTIQRAMSSIEPGSKMRILLVIFFLLSYGICDVDIYIYICFCTLFFFNPFEMLSSRSQRRLYYMS